MSTSAFHKIDHALNLYYSRLNVKYLNENSIGKFISFVEEQEFDSDEIEDELGDDADVNDCAYLDFEYILVLFICVSIDKIVEFKIPHSSQTRNLLTLRRELINLRYR